MSAWSNTDTNLSKPKYVKYGDRNNNNANVYGVSNLERQQMANSASFANSAAHAGWVKIIPQYTDSSGNIRRKAETLVVMSTPISGNANVQLSGRAATVTGTLGVTGTLVAANSYVLFSGNIAALLTANTQITVGNTALVVNSVVSSTNAKMTSSPVFSASGLAVNYSGANLVVTGTGTQFNKELKIGDIINTGNIGSYSTTRRVTAIANATSLTVNTAFTAANVSMPMYVGDGAWFPLS